MARAFQPSPFHRLANVFLAPRSRGACYSVAALIAVALIANLFPLSFLAGHGAFFENGDASQHVGGWLFYVRDEWRFPLLQTERLNHPSGTNIAFTDSIPLAALAFKALAGWLPPGFHYFGLWHALAFLTQAVAAVFLVRVLGAHSLLAAVSAALFALTWPALLWRIGHPSLMTQGIVLAALGIYFLGRQGRWSGGASSLALITLSLCGLLVHPYFLAFCYPIFLAFVIEQGLDGEGWLRQFMRVAASVAVILIVGYVLGYFGHGGTTTFGYGYYSTNLNTPFCGGRLIGCNEALQHQFAEYRFSDATGGQYEGFTYFGAGVLMLMPFALVIGARDIPGALKRHRVLVVTLLLFAFYAATNTAYFGANELWSFALPAGFDRITGTFRASGRFFWPIAYVVLFTIIAAVLKRRSALAAILVLLALTLQWADVALLRERVSAKASALSSGDLERWGEIMARVDKVNIYPAFGCGDADVNLYWFFQRLAAEYGKLLDTGYIARPNVDCEANRRAFDTPFQPRQLYVMPADYIDNPFVVPDGFRQASRRGECIRWRIAAVCMPDATTTTWGRVGGKLLAPLKPHAEWPAQALRSEVGQVVDGRLVSVTTDKPGFLSYGPYITLPPGRYHYTIDYSSQADPSSVAGRWDIVLNGGRTLAQGPMPGTRGTPGHIEGEFEADGTKLPLEIRTFYPGGVDLQLSRIALKKISQ